MTDPNTEPVTRLQHPDWTGNDQDWLNNCIADTIYLTLQQVWSLDPHYNDNESVVGDVAPFTILLDGAWGSGKSWIIRKIKEKLSINTSPPILGWAWSSGKRWSIRRIKEKLSRKSWPPIVVQINAWRHQAAGPLWYTSLEFIRKKVEQEEGCWTALKMGFRYSVQFHLAPFIWDMLPLLSVMAIFLLAWLLALCLHWPWIEMDLMIKGFAFLASIAAILQTVIQAWHLSTPTPGDANRAMLRMLRNPEQKVRDFFNSQLPKHTTRPVLVMIDELDRCEPKVVVELLAALQNLMQGRKLVYLVAADRRWLRRCVEIHHSELRDGSSLADGKVGEALLSKVFQLVVTVPRVTERSIRYYAKCRLAGCEQEGQPNAGSKSGPHVNDVQGWMNEAMAVGAPLLAGNPRLVNRFYFDLWFRIQWRLAMKLALNKEILQHLGAASLVRVRWPALADFMADQPPAAINGLIALKRMSGRLQAPDEVVSPLAEPMADIFSSPDWLAFCLSPLMPRRVSELVNMVAAG